MKTTRKKLTDNDRYLVELFCRATHFSVYDCAKPRQRVTLLADRDEAIRVMRDSQKPGDRRLIYGFQLRPYADCSFERVLLTPALLAAHATMYPTNSRAA